MNSTVYQPVSTAAKPAAINSCNGSGKEDGVEIKRYFVAFVLPTHQYVLASQVVLLKRTICICLSAKRIKIFLIIIMQYYYSYYY